MSGFPNGGAGVGSSAPLALVQYAPLGESGNIAPSTFAAIDTTNLSISFVAPASGRVLLVLSGIVGNSPTGYHWGVVTHGTTTLVGYLTVFFSNCVGYYEQLITGLTPEAAYVWDWAHYTSGSGGGLFITGSTAPSGGGDGPALMKVVAA